MDKVTIVYAILQSICIVVFFTLGHGSYLWYGEKFYETYWGQRFLADFFSLFGSLAMSAAYGWYRKEFKEVDKSGEEWKGD